MCIMLFTQTNSIQYEKLYSKYQDTIYIEFTWLIHHCMHYISECAEMLEHLNYLIPLGKTSEKSIHI